MRQLLLSSVLFAMGCATTSVPAGPGPCPVSPTPAQLASRCPADFSAGVTTVCGVQVVAAQVTAELRSRTTAPIIARNRAQAQLLEQVDILLATAAQGYVPSDDEVATVPTGRSSGINTGLERIASAGTHLEHPAEAYPTVCMVLTFEDMLAALADAPEWPPARVAWVREHMPAALAP